MAPAASSKRAPASEGSESESESDDELDSGSENGQVQQKGVADDEDEVQEFKLDVSKLDPLSPQVISKQATINIGQSGCLGHAA